jgi:phosphoglycerol transferase MdoB-like AlkP superfamily enzyme
MRRDLAALVQRRPTLIFWAAFLTLNTLLFLPFYLLNRPTSALFPVEVLHSEGFWRAVSQLVLWRENLDPWRLSLELTLLVALWRYFGWVRRALVRVLVVTVYLVALVYALYEAVITSIYRVDPIFYSQYYLARDGLPFLLRHLQTSALAYLAAGVGLVAALLLVVGMVNLLLNSAAEPKLHRSAPVGLALLAVFSLFAAVRYQGETAQPEMVVSSLVFKLRQNFTASIQLYEDIASFDEDTPVRAYNYLPYRLRNKPNIYLIFIESYGSVLYKRPDYEEAYTRLLDELEQQLAADGWQSVTALSESTTWGGGSWMAYTSLLFGLRIDTHPHYLTLFNAYQAQPYPNLGRYLQSQGYYYSWVSSIADELNDETWAKYIRFLGVDEWLRYRDLEYTGPRYGWGPAPPDQYVLNFTDELLRAQSDQPLFFVTLTQNSHYPWEPQPQLVADWRTLTGSETGDPEAPVDVAHADKRQHYLQAITYQLRMLADFIVDHPEEQSLFILVGDHQPPQVSRRSDGWDTPMHIISQDEALLAAFSEYGFSPGLRAASLNPNLRHEAFYSLLMRVLLGYENVARVALPPYLPHGVTTADVPEPTGD